MVGVGHIRRDVPRAGDEKSVLVALLDIQRAAVRAKLEGLAEEAARRPGVPSGTSLLGIVKHLAYVERWWFRLVFAGEDVEYPASDEDPDADWRLDESDSVSTVVAFYEDECERSRALVAAVSLDAMAVGGEPINLRWIVAHMIEETARHAGHADILRELIDGTTGR